MVETIYLGAEKTNAIYAGSVVELSDTTTSAKARSSKTRNRDRKKFILTGWTVIDVIAHITKNDANERCITDVVVRLWNEAEYVDCVLLTFCFACRTKWHEAHPSILLIDAFADLVPRKYC